MKVLLVGKKAKDIAQLVTAQGLSIVTQNPNLVISYGGDGTLLSAERQYPGIPKLPIRNSQFCHKCPNHQDEVVLKKLLANQLELKGHKKLHTNIYGKDLYALNDFVIRNSDPTHTIRFRVTSAASHPELARPERGRGVSGSIQNKLFIGDGIVVSTPFGSTGYFKSITGQSFEQGFGVAFNNTTQKVNPLNLTDTDSLTFQLIRGKTTLSFDNSPDVLTIDERSELIFKSSNQVAKIYEDTSLRCPNCQVIRG